MDFASNPSTTANFSSVCLPRPRRSRIWSALLFGGLLLLPLSGCTGSGAAGTSSAGGSSGKLTVPSDELSPAEVVRIQVESLLEKGQGGIEQAFQFASPNNRRLTGPLERFASLMKSESYQPLQTAREADYFRVEVDGERAQQIVALTTADGYTHFYLFELSRQQAGEFEGCWMTDSVMKSPVALPPRV